MPELFDVDSACWIDECEMIADGGTVVSLDGCKHDIDDTCTGVLVPYRNDDGTLCKKTLCDVTCKEACTEETLYYTLSPINPNGSKQQTTVTFDPKNTIVSDDINVERGFKNVAIADNGYPVVWRGSANHVSFPVPDNIYIVSGFPPDYVGFGVAPLSEPYNTEIPVWMIVGGWVDTEYRYEIWDDSWPNLDDAPYEITDPSDGSVLCTGKLTLTNSPELLTSQQAYFGICGPVTLPPGNYTINAKVTESVTGLEYFATVDYTVPASTAIPADVTAEWLLWDTNNNAINVIGSATHISYDIEGGVTKLPVAIPSVVGTGGGDDATGSIIFTNATDYNSGGLQHSTFDHTWGIYPSGTWTIETPLVDVLVGVKCVRPDGTVEYYLDENGDVLTDLTNVMNP